MTFYNIAFTGPIFGGKIKNILGIGLFMKDLSKDTIRSNPKLYKSMINQPKLFSFSNFLIWILYAFIEGFVSVFVIFFSIYFTNDTVKGDGSNIGLFMVGICTIQNVIFGNIVISFSK